MNNTERYLPINQETVTDLAEHLIPRWPQLDAFHQRVAKEQILDALNHAHNTTITEREEGTNGHD